MAYTVRELINKSWYLSGIVAKRFQTPSGEQVNDGLDMLNALLAIKTANQRLIPYYTEYEFDTEIGVGQYFIPNLILAETVAFDLDQVRYPMSLVGRYEFFATARANNVQSLPYQYFIERTLNGSTLYVYFFPDQEYNFHIHGKFSLGDVTLDQDLEEDFDQYYIEYLRYALAEYMCQEYNVIFQVESKKNLKEMESIIFDIAPIDFTIRKKSMLQRQVGPDIYGQVNIGKGWTRAN